jgi:hypothetical protein
MKRSVIASMFAVVGIGIGFAGAPPAAAASFITADGCPHHQAFVEGDEAAVAAALPDAYTPVRAPSGRPLLFVRAIRCDAIGVENRSAPGTMASFGVVVESPDGLGCASAAPGAGALKGDVPPVCNWYLLSWLADDARVVRWLREGTPGFPALHVPGLEFELGADDPARGGAPLRFRTPASAPSPFAIDAVGRERPGEIAVRGGYWADTPEGTVKLALSTDDLASGDATGSVTAAPGTLLARLMGAERRDYVPGYSSLAAERWQRASYRKQRLAPAPRTHAFGGSCSLPGTVRFTPRATNAEARDLTYAWESSGTCTGTLNGRAISEAPVKAAHAGPANATCNRARTLAPGTSALTFAGGERIPYTLDFRSTGTEVDFTFYGERSGFARGHGSFLTDRTPPEVFQQCRGEGVSETPLDLTLTSERVLVSQPPPRRAARARPKGCPASARSRDRRTRRPSARRRADRLRVVRRSRAPSTSCRAARR